MSAPLIQLTQLAHPLVEGGRPTAAFVNPHHIVSVELVLGAFNGADGRPMMAPTQCTRVLLAPGAQLLVIETPTVVAAAREHALRDSEDH